MDKLFTGIKDLFSNLYTIAINIKPVDILDILIIAVCIYALIVFIRETRAGQVTKGLVLLVALYFAADLIGLEMVGNALSYFFRYAFIAMMILFQPELRKALEQIGRSKVGTSLTHLFSSGGDDTEYNRQVKKSINAVVEAVSSLQQMKMGALIIFERKTKLGEIAETGTVVNAEPSGMLIGNIFFNKAPLHDGAMIIRDGKVLAAGCILPLTKNNSISASYGTRHRAALGMSEESDAIVVVVSEETAKISTAINGSLKSDYTKETLREVLLDSLTESTQDESRMNRLPLVRKLKKNS